MKRYRVKIEADAVPIEKAPPRNGSVTVEVEAKNRDAAIAQAVLDSNMWALLQDYSVRVRRVEAHGPYWSKLCSD